MNLLDEDYLVAGVLFGILSTEVFKTNVPLGIIALLAAGYAIWNAFVTIDPTGV